MRTRNQKCFVCGASLAGKQYDKVTVIITDGRTSRETWEIACRGRCATKLSQEYMKVKKDERV